MARIAVIGGTGYAGKNIVAEAVARGHQAVSIARSVPTERQDGVLYAEGNILDPQSIVAAADGADVVVFATSPRGDMAGATRTAVANVIDVLPADVRVGVVGGAGGSLIAEGGVRLVDSGFPEEFKAEALEMIDVLDDLQQTDAAHDWFFIHPAGGFGPWNDGPRTGTYRDGGDVLVVDEAGESNISGADFGIDVLDEIENRRHIGERFTVGY
ncbi:NAD(P)-dependent oxidoreductase [Microbacterium sp. NC79]|uniref:NAD(P)-dependent oxidoreductase n=1 Tax=Microbacterium sp. NC79 TaxID=2851009 RepID=UPI001C2BE3A1|nr:NAD(P)H-binding protein [Microbacterium sp. NC79]MBV0895466.1 NAD(P)H-binding protein [Microbacterium sp. NC79]